MRPSSNRFWCPEFRLSGSRFPWTAAIFGNGVRPSSGAAAYESPLAPITRMRLAVPALLRPGTVALLICGLAALASAAEWVNISDSVTSQVKPGYAGPTAGVTVDRVSGDVYMVVNDQGLWKSTDHGQTFTRVDDKNIG